VKIFISFDMEGVAGIVDWAQCGGPGQAYEEGRKLLLGEVNAAIDGALTGGATEIVCNDSVDAVFFIGYHGSISGMSSVLSHTYNPSVVSRAELNGVECGESGINALVALACGAPVVLITGDQQTISEGDPFFKEAERVS